MTGPLAQQIAQVRDELNRCAFGTESTTGLHDALAALSVIERHVQDMETALDEGIRMMNRTFANRGKWLSACERWEKKARAALPAREKGTE